MKKVILLSVSFLVITLFLSLPAFADSSWSYTSISGAKGVLKDANGNPMKVTVTLNFDVLNSGPSTTIKYSPDQLVFNLSNTDISVNSLVDTDISISGTVDSNDTFSITGGMHGGALTVKHISTVTASYNTDSETAHPFSFNDTIYSHSMTGDGLMTSAAEGTLVESFNKAGDQNKAKINMTFRFVGKLDDTNPALITVTLSGTVSKTP
jgi:hypothetical protein